MPGVGFGAPGYGPGMDQNTVKPDTRAKEDAHRHGGFEHPVL